MTKRKAAKTTSIERRAGEAMTIPLSRLVESERNVRKKYSEGSIDELAASIDAQGLLKNLSVIEQTNRRGQATGCYEVIDGRRRLRALRKLAKAGKIKRDEPILCKVGQPEQARIVSLAANLGHEPMHPADEFDAFRALIDEGHSVDEVAMRFGLSPLTVQRRLKLANVAPELLAEYREDKIALEQLIALAITDDHAAQLRVWRDTPDYQRRPDYLRRQLLAAELDAREDPVVRFVTVKAYEKAGGTLRRDLFDTDENTGYVTDPELLTRLANAKLARHADKVRAEGWAWIHSYLRPNYETLAAYGHASRTLREATAEEAEQDERLTARETELRAQLTALDEGGDEQAIADAERQLEETQEALADLQEARREWSQETKALAGAVVLIDHAGKIDVRRGLIRPEDRRSPAHKPKTAANGAGGTGTAPQEHDHSEALLRRLTAQRTVALQASLAATPKAALAALACVLAERTLFDATHRLSAPLDFSARAQWRALALAAGAEIEQAKAWTVLKDKSQQWCDRLQRSERGLLLTVLDLPESDLLDLLATCTALTVDTVYPKSAVAGVGALAKAAALDMHQWWQPTAANYFSALSKDRILAILRENCAPEALTDVAKLKKNDLAQRAEQLMAASGWLPEPLLG